MKNKDKKTCKTCNHWKSKQSLLNYGEYDGICVNEKNRFNIGYGRAMGVIDRQNPKKVVGLPSHDFETIGNHNGNVMESRYLLQTSEDFGCINHE